MKTEFMKLDNLVDFRLMLIDIAEHCTGYIRKLIMQTPKKGKWYRIPNLKKKYRASAPGQPPAIRTGALKDSIARSNPVYNKGKYKIAIGSNLETKYPMFLELGTSRIKRRPVWERALKDEVSKNKIFNIIKKYWRHK